MVEFNFRAGDFVKLRLAKREVEGRVLESSDSSVVLLKLSSGYNIGLQKENILGGKVLKKFKEMEKGEVEIKRDAGKKNVGLIVTGGTIASKLDSRTGGVKHLVDVGEFAKFYPELFELVNVSKIEVPFMKASESMGWEDWRKIAEVVKEMLDDNKIEGVIITHGTDFLHYTSAALGFFLRDLSKPVVLTYSQRSIDRASSDANLNLQCAAQLAMSEAAEVMLVGHANMDDEYCHALLGSKVRKLHSSRRDAFKPVNIGPLAKVYVDKVEWLRDYSPRNSGEVKLDLDYSDKVALVKFYPGQDSSILDFYALKYKGLVIEGSGLGHLPVSESEDSWIPRVKKHIRNGMVVCLAGQSVFGRVDPYVYSNGRELLEAGVIFLEDMLAETAFVKLGWVLGHRGWKGKAKEKMLENISGELNERAGKEFL
jgi:glutamyl-tRNA(Gln) amidotransferase subunit D